MKMLLLFGRIIITLVTRDITFIIIRNGFGNQNSNPEKLKCMNPSIPTSTAPINFWINYRIDWALNIDMATDLKEEKALNSNQLYLAKKGKKKN